MISKVELLDTTFISLKIRLALWPISFTVNWYRIFENWLYLSYELLPFGKIENINVRLVIIALRHGLILIYASSR